MRFVCSPALRRQACSQDVHLLAAAAGLSTAAFSCFRARDEQPRTSISFRTGVWCDDSSRQPCLVQALPCGLRVLDQIAWWNSVRSIQLGGKLNGLLEGAGVEFYDETEHRKFIKAPMVSMVALGGVPVRAGAGDSLEFLFGGTVSKVPLEDVRASLRNQLGMTAMYSYLNPKGVEPAEMWTVVAKHGHFSVGHTASVSFVIAGLSCAVENEFNSQRDVVHLGRLTVARTGAQKDPPLVVQRPELLPMFQQIRAVVTNDVLSQTGQRPKGEDNKVSLGDWQEALHMAWPAAKAHVAVLSGSLRSVQKLLASIDDSGKETEYRAILWQLAAACHALLPDMFAAPDEKYKWRPPPHLLPENA